MFDPLGIASTKILSPHTDFMPKASHTQAELLLKQKEYLREVVIDVETMAMFDSLPGFLCFLKNRAGEHLYASALWTTRHGFREAWEMLLKTDQDLTPGVMAESYLADDAIVYRTGKPVVDKVEICLDPVGLPDWHVTSKYPVRNRKGEIIGILGISRVCMGQSPIASLNVRIGPATKMLQANLLEYPSAQVLAEACDLSVRQLQRRFTDALGLSPRDYWMKCRIRAACESIIKGEEKLGSLSMRLGFCDQSSFTAQFRRHTGVTPSAFARGKKTLR